MVEHLTTNQGVVGSSPTEIDIFFEIATLSPEQELAISFKKGEMERRAHVCSSRPKDENLEGKLNYPLPNDGWEEIAKSLLTEKVHTEGFLKDYLRKCMDNDTRAPEMLDENEAQKFAFGQVANEVYDKMTESLNVDDFVNATGKSLNRFMAEDYLFCKNELYSSQVDKEIFARANEYTSHDMLTLLLDRVYRSTVDKLHCLQKWKRNIDSYLLSNPVMDERYQTHDEHPSLTSRSKHFNKKCDSLRNQKTVVQTLISKAKEDVEVLGKYLLDYRDVFESIRGVFEKPGIDVSARAKLLAKHDQIRLEKLLFNTQDSKDVANGLTQHKIEQYIVDEIIHRYKNISIKAFNENLKLLPNSIYTKYLAQTQTRFFTRYDTTSARLRIQFPDTKDRVFKLSTVLPDPAPHKYLVNFYESLLDLTGQTDKYLKFTFTGRRLTNLLVSTESLSVIINTLRSDEQQIAKTFSELMETPKPPVIFTEVNNFPSFVFTLMFDCLQYFPAEIFSATVKLSTDYAGNEGEEYGLTPLEKNLNDHRGLKYWMELLTEKEKFELFNQKVDEVFQKLTLVQNEFLHFEDFYSPSKVLDINAISQGIKYRERQEGEKGLLYSYLTLNEGTKVKKAFWIKESLLFKVTQKQPNEHHNTQLLKDQLKHPQIEAWLQLILSLDPAGIKYDLNRFTEELLEKVGVRTENLKREKKLATFTMASYLKLFMLRGRNSCLKLISYFNFARSVQKVINLRFLSTVEEGRQAEEWAQNSPPQSYKKEDFLKMARMFDPKEYAELKKIFDDEAPSSKPKEFFGYSDFDPKFNRLIVKPDYRPYLFTNPSKGGFFGGVVLGMDFGIQQEDFGGESSIGYSEDPKSKIAPENPFAEDIIEFKDISKTLLERGNIRSCPFVEVRDSTGLKVVYDAAIHDFFDVVNDLSLLASFYLENELIYYQDDQFEDLDLQFEDNQKGNIFTQKNIHLRVSRFDETFNYEYFLTKLLEHECLFQSAKARYVKQILDLTEQVSEPRESVKLFDLLADIMSRRPQFDICKYAYHNQNSIERLQRVTLKRNESASDQAEMTNLVTTIFDNYKLETEYMAGLAELVESLVGHQMDIADRVESVLKTFEAFQGGVKNNPKETFEQFKPKIWAEQIRRVVKTIETSSSVLFNSFVSPSQVDRTTFSSFLFDFHYKRLIEEYLDMPEVHKVDFLGCLNDFINGLSGRYRFFIEQSLRSLILGETKAQIMAIFEGAGLGDDLAMFEGEVLPTPQHCFSVLATTYSFFKTQTRSTVLTTFDSTEGVNILDKEGFIQQANRYFAYLMNFGLSMDLRESMLSIGHSTSISKASLDIIQPVYEALTKNSKFEKPEDMLNTQGNLFIRLMDFGEACSFTVDDVKAILKVDLARGSDSTTHLGKLKSLKDLLDALSLSLNMNVQLNTLGDRLIESETIMHITRILTSKESVFEHVYRFQLGKKSETPKYILKELKEEFLRGDNSFKFFLLSSDLPFYEITNSYLQLNKKAIHVSPQTILNAIVSRASHLLGPSHKDLKTDLDPNTLESDLGSYFSEHSLSLQEVEGSRTRAGKDKKASKRICKVEIPSKDTKLESVCLTVSIHPFVREALPLFRRQADYLALWLQTYKMMQTLFERSFFMSYNPSEVIGYQREQDLGLSRLQQTIMRTLKYKNSRPQDDDYDILEDSAPLFDEYGAIKSIFKVLPMKQFKDLIARDQEYLLEKEVSSKERSFFHSLEFFIFKKTKVKPALKVIAYPHKHGYEEATPLQVAETTEILSNARREPTEIHDQADAAHFYTDGYIRDMHAHLRRLKGAEINAINRISTTTASERLSTKKILSGLHKHKFYAKKKKQLNNFGFSVGFSDMVPTINLSSKKFKVDRVSRAGNYDEFEIEETQETDLFIYYTQTNKLLTVLSLKLLMASLDHDENETSLLQKKMLPFYTLNNLRLNELEELLFHNAADEDAADELLGGQSNKELKKEDVKSISQDSKSKTGRTEDNPRDKGIFDKSVVPPSQTNRDRTVSPSTRLMAENESDLQIIPETNGDESAKQSEILDENLDNAQGMDNADHLNHMSMLTRKPKFAYRRLRNYLYTVKRIELKNRSNSRSIFDFIEEVKNKMASVLEDTKFTKPDTVFNTYLNCIFENEQRVFTIAMLDTMAQLRWLENFSDLVDINLDKMRQDNQMFYQVRGLLINHLFPKHATLKIFYDLFTNKHLGEECSLVVDAYPYKGHDNVLAKQLSEKSLKSIVRKNNVLNLFESCFLSQTQAGVWNNGFDSFNEFSHQDFDSKWDNLFTQLLSFRSPERTFISKKIFQIRLSLERDISIPTESIQPHNIWIYKMLDSNRVLDLNVKNLLLFEAINSTVINDLFCDVDKERSSIKYEDQHLNGLKFETDRRQIIPSLLPFVSNSMFQKKENYDFNRIVLKIMAMELRLTSTLFDRDLTLERFPDINFTAPQETTAANSEVDIKLKKFITVDSVWSNDPFILQKAEQSEVKYNGEEENPNSLEKPISIPYRKDVYNNHKQSILRAFVETLRESWFQQDIDQAYNTNYLLLKELAGQTVKQETVRLRMIRNEVGLKSDKSRLLDKLSVSLNRQALNTLLSNSYVLETSSGEDYLAIGKSDLNEVVLNWHQQFMESMQEELRTRELTYLIKMDDINQKTESNTLNKELIDFYFAHLMSVFKKAVNSKLVMRNSNFITDLDTLARYSTFMNTDADLTYHKILAQLDNDARTFLSEKEEENRKLKAAGEAAVLNLKAELIAAVVAEKETTLKLMKERTEALQLDKDYPHPPAGQHVNYEVKVPLYKRRLKLNFRRRVP